MNAKGRPAFTFLSASHRLAERKILLWAGYKLQSFTGPRSLLAVCRKKNERTATMYCESCNRGAKSKKIRNDRVLAYVCWETPDAPSKIWTVGGDDFGNIVCGSHGSMSREQCYINLRYNYSSLSKDLFVVIGYNTLFISALVWFLSVGSDVLFDCSNTVFALIPCINRSSRGGARYSRRRSCTI